MKRGGWAVVVAVVLCAVGAVLWWRNGLEQAQLRKADGPAQRPPAGATRLDAPVTPESSALPQVASQPAPRVDYAARLRAASDYLDFVRSLQGAASTGDHAAQFYTFRAFDYCDDGYRGYFWSRRGRLTLDDALKRAATRFPFDTDEVRRVHARCHRLMELDARELGERLEWLRLAAQGGYPLAQVVAAQQLWRAVGEADDAAKVEERRRLVAMAIRSREPEVIWEIGSTPLDFKREVIEVEGVKELVESNEYDLDHMAWWLAACTRGFDCSPRSEIVWQLCRFDPNCQPYETVTDLVRRASGNGFPEIEARARWINEKIDAGDWEALGF